MGRGGKQWQKSPNFNLGILKTKFFKNVWIIDYSPTPSIYEQEHQTSQRGAYCTNLERKWCERTWKNLKNTKELEINERNEKNSKEQENLRQLLIN